VTSAVLVRDPPPSPPPDPPASPPPDLEGRIIDATLACVARWGLSKTTLEDVARQAQCGRATVYRLFPGGKEALLRAVGRSEVARVGAAIGARCDDATTLEDLLTTGLAEAARQVRHHPALTFLLANEPEAVVPWLAFQRGEELLAFAVALAAPHLARFLAPDEARRAAEWTARVLLAFCLCPAPGVDLSDDGSTRSVVTTFLLPGLAPDR
jgi:AcrR family transcriptional regulator